MNLSNINANEMTDEERTGINRIIGEWYEKQTGECWHIGKPYFDYCHRHEERGDRNWCKLNWGQEGREAHNPDYTGDLNACHKAEMEMGYSTEIELAHRGYIQRYIDANSPADMKSYTGMVAIVLRLSSEVRSLAMARVIKEIAQ
jgi:hypothetical protein